MVIDFAHKEHPLVAMTDKAVIPVTIPMALERETGIQKPLKDEISWAPAFAGATNQFNKCFCYELDQ